MGYDGIFGWGSQFREIEPMPLPVGEHKHNTLSEVTTVVDVKCDCR
jgi:hypothetical protein